MGDAGPIALFVAALAVYFTLCTLGMVTQLHEESLRSGELRLPDGSAIGLVAASPNTVIGARTGASSGLGSALAKGAFEEAGTHYLRITSHVSAASVARVGTAPVSTVGQRRSASISAKSNNNNNNFKEEEEQEDAGGVVVLGGGDHGRASTMVGPVTAPPAARATNSGEGNSMGNAAVDRDVVSHGIVADPRSGVPSSVSTGDKVLILRLNDAATGAALWEVVAGRVDGETPVSRDVFLRGGTVLSLSEDTAGAYEPPGDCGYLAPQVADPASYPLRAGVDTVWVAYLARLAGNGTQPVDGLDPALTCWSGPLAGASDGVNMVPISSAPVALDYLAGDTFTVRVHVGISRTLLSLSRPGASWLYAFSIVVAVLSTFSLVVVCAYHGHPGRAVWHALLPLTIIGCGIARASTAESDGDGAGPGLALLVALYLAEVTCLLPLTIVFSRGRSLLLSRLRDANNNSNNSNNSNGRVNANGDHPNGDDVDERVDHALQSAGAAVVVGKYIMLGCIADSQVGVGLDEEDRGGGGGGGGGGGARGVGANGRPHGGHHGHAGRHGHAGHHSSRGSRPVGRPPRGPSGRPGSAAGGRRMSNASLGGDSHRGTPRRAREEYRSLSTLPPSENADDARRLFCPICMLYFDRVYGTSCCRQHICDECAREYCESRGEPGPGHTAVAVPQPDTAPCPHCRAIGFAFLPILEADGSLRRYEDSPAAQRDHQARRREMFHSPLKVGDSYEAMRRKMVTLEEAARPVSRHSNHQGPNGPNGQNMSSQWGGHSQHSQHQQQSPMQRGPSLPQRTPSRGPATPLAGGRAFYTPSPRRARLEALPPLPGSAASGNGYGNGYGHNGNNNYVGGEPDLPVHAYVTPRGSGLGARGGGPPGYVASPTPSRGQAPSPGVGVALPPVRSTPRR